MKTKIIILSSVFFLAACNYNVDKTDALLLEPTPSETIDDEVVTFQMVNERVITPQCLRCHSTVSGHFINLENYENVFMHRELIREAVITMTMPKAPARKLNQAQIDFIVKWIDAGASEFGKLP